jgi:hypothetical protein
MIFNNPEINRLFVNIKNKIYLSSLKLSKNFFLKIHNERVIEIPYLLSRYNNQKNILEVGLSLADRTLVKSLIYLKKLKKLNLYALDLIDIEKCKSRFKGLSIKKNFIFKQIDIRNFKLKKKFDFITLISTLEHVGFDEKNTNKKIKGVFLERNYNEIKNNNADFVAFKNLANTLDEGGSIIVTLPFGSRRLLMANDSFGLTRYYREYNYLRVLKLIRISRLKLLNIEFYQYKNKWKKIVNFSSFSNDRLAKYKPVKSIVCFELKKINKKIYNINK